MASMDLTVYMDGMLENMTDSIYQESHEGIMEHLSRHSRKCAELWACEVCEQVHEINEEDLPLAKGMDTVYGRDHTANTAAKSASKTLTAHVSGISHRHIQMALKLTRLAREGQPYHNDYCRKLTDAYTIDDNSSMSRTHKISLAPRSSGLPNSFTPKIVKDADGSLRFLLQTVYQIGGDNAPAGINVCPHKQVKNPSKLAASSKHNSGRCKYCATRYVISATQIRIVEDFGTEGSPADLHWQAHLNPKVKRQGARHVPLAKGVSMESLFDAPKSSSMAAVMSDTSDDKEPRVGDKMRSAMNKMKSSLRCSFDF
ncbi:hypothetical protein SBRCBS47491_003211 [Sporothrix bragantina]|uniref:Uncharacterized protein n=1 Tax=Sporothrix bragantina TaxID=671064 RepID=A0ABP0BDM0_9PEZI